MMGSFKWQESATQEGRGKGVILCVHICVVVHMHTRIGCTHICDSVHVHVRRMHVN